jgi:arylsulfatase A-like enzyme
VVACVDLGGRRIIKKKCTLFLWAHLYDAHRPYDPPEPYRSRYADPYLGEIAFAEAQVDRLLGAFERRRLLDNTLFIVVADHGESLGEHGEENHGTFLYQGVLRIPLVIRLPRRARGERATGARVGDLVRIVDVMPTVLDVLGVRAPATDGVSLLGVMNGHPLDLEGYAESMYPIRFGQAPLRVLRDGRFKLIDGSSPELYDLERDPFETRNIYHDRPTVAQAMTARVDSIEQRGPERAGAVEVPADLRDRLQALGYVGSAPPTSRRPEDRPDPKDRIARRPRQSPPDHPASGRGLAERFRNCEELRKD